MNPDERERLRRLIDAGRRRRIAADVKRRLCIECGRPVKQCGCAKGERRKRVNV